MNSGDVGCATGTVAAPCTELGQSPRSPKWPQDSKLSPLSTQVGPLRWCPALGVTDPVKLLLVAEERVVAAVLALPVLGNEEASPLPAAAGGDNGLAGGDVGSPELVGHSVANVVEELWGQGGNDVRVGLGGMEHGWALWGASEGLFWGWEILMWVFRTQSYSGEQRGEGRGWGE